MFSFLERFLAFRFFFSKRKERFISVNVIFSIVGISLGVATLIIVMSVFNGFRDQLVGKILGLNSHITIFASGKQLQESDKIIRELKKNKQILEVNQLIDAHGLVLKNELASATAVKGIKAEDLKNKALIRDNVMMGKLDNFSRDSVVIGDILANKLGVQIGDYVRLVSPQANKSILGVIPRMKDYKVTAIYSVGMHEYDSKVIFIPLKMAQIQFNYGDKVSAIEIKSKNYQDLAVLTQDISDILQELDVDANITDWQALNSSFINALNIERNVMFLILSLIIIVAAFNIISSLVMLVNDKNKHVAILKTMGMGNNAIVRIFFINGAIIGFIGTFIGATLGTLFAYNIQSIKSFLESLTGATLFDPLIYFLTELPAEVDFSMVVLVVLTSLLITFLAAIYPARKAAKLQPAEILRNE
jgi:lipoprotein-releasing system permease protein